MKNITIIALMFFVTVSFSAFAASDDPTKVEVKVMATDHDAFKVVYRSGEIAPVKVNIYNEKNRRIYSDWIKDTDGFSKLYNFKNLKRGKYTFEFISNGQTTKEEVYHALPKMAAEKMKAFINPIDGSQKFKVMVMGNEVEAITVKVYSKTGTILHQKSYAAECNTGFVYNLDRLSSQEIRFEVSSGGEILKSQSFNL